MFCPSGFLIFYQHWGVISRWCRDLIFWPWVFVLIWRSQIIPTRGGQVVVIWWSHVLPTRGTHIQPIRRSQVLLVWNTINPKGSCFPELSACVSDSAGVLPLMRAHVVPVLTADMLTSSEDFFAFCQFQDHTLTYTKSAFSNRIAIWKFCV